MSAKLFMTFSLGWLIFFFLDALTAQAFTTQSSVLNDIFTTDLIAWKTFLIIDIPLPNLSFIPSILRAATSDFWFFTGVTFWVRWFVSLVILAGIIYGITIQIAPILASLIAGIGSMVRSFSPFGS